jgi:hypothetical protein
MILPQITLGDIRQLIPISPQNTQIEIAKKSLDQILSLNEENSQADTTPLEKK